MSLHLGGDGQFGSPGFRARYVVTVIDAKGKIGIPKNIISMD